jgi:signal transduction histidine kinase
MNQHLQILIDSIQRSETLSSEEKNALLISLKAADKELEITAFKLDRTEKVKRTTAILLEETIEELEQKRKAVEAQNRELEIESSLERVRTVAMSMNKPEDMVNVCNVISDQLQLLGVKDIRNVQTAIIHEQKGTYLNYQYFAAYKDGVVEETEYNNHPTVLAMVEEMKKSANSTFSGIMKGKELITFRDWRKQNNQFPDPILDEVDSAYYYFYSIGLGGLGLTTYKTLSEEGLEIFKRFHNVFTLAYRRFTDIELALAQAREAQIQLALERVRAKSLAMHHTSELQEVVNIVAQQLHHMNIDINGGAFITINDEVDDDFTLWASGGAADYVQKVTVPFMNTPIFTLLRDAIKRKNNFFTEEHSQEEKIRLFEHLFKYPPWNSLTQQRKQDLLSREGGYTRSVAISQYTSIAITNHNGKVFTDDENEVLKRFGNVFEQSYIRFLDLQKAEAQAWQAEQDLIEIKEARKKAEETLTELQSTQAQLIQAEKMASLGELTAGIAHEIQNPLNFVNNFSEVSSELISEMVEEVDKGNFEEVKAIAGDVKQNLDKINHHGKRAGDIVKGMLQHSRTSSGQKELTDINALADEYLRLAFHGLRAKDKDFNADFKTELDETFPKINIIPQDIGRVLLNLINNAFYAVSEKKRQSSGDYKPVLLLTTKKSGDQIEIKVKDNGNGIPAEILGKVFQPFFTTKPAGQGTGLGLSLSYDIVTKGHGGELFVETRAGEGSEFIVKLPVSTNKISA